MIGNYKGTVKNRVVTALLQAYLDVLDYDGMKSILNEAEMLHLKDKRDVDPNQTMDFFSFKKIIAAQNCLLYYSTDLLFEIGKKFSFYLFPYGKSFEDSIEEINDLIKTDWEVKILDKHEDKIIVKVSNCIFCSEIGVPCDLFRGFLVNSLEKTLSSEYKVTYEDQTNDVNDKDHNSFIITLKVKKIENIN
ncbi:MAG: hypothetical protein BAJALOKI2v1_170044 [Promethearchaeota archaeon]|nr:MAG: hypothetical protein BAJALOKI2v1_170044 [Candidatus Lokiarchaeota archaeon]